VEGELKILLLYLGSFLLGGIPFGYLVGKRLYRVDIRSKGSGNIGATNVLRTLGVLPGLMVLITDVLKGAIPVIIGRFIGLPSELYLLAGAISVLGHCISPFLNFKGGKGVSSTFGMIVAFDPLTAVLSFLVEVLFVAIWRYVSLGFYRRSYCDGVPSISSRVALSFSKSLLKTEDLPTFTFPTKVTLI
jgi:Predicted membrane protein